MTFSISISGSPESCSGSAYYDNQSKSAGGPLASVADELVSFVLQQHETAASASASAVSDDGDVAYWKKTALDMRDERDSLQQRLEAPPAPAQEA